MSDGGWESGWPVGPDGQPLTPEQVSALGINITGANPNVVRWQGASRGSPSWTPPSFTQTYGNYTGMFPSMGQQVGQALYGSIQAQNTQPAWMQTRLPSRQNSQVSMNKYSPFQSGGRTMANPYPANGAVDLVTPKIGTVSNRSNPFIGGYQGLGGSPGAGPGTGITPNPVGIGDRPFGIPKRSTPSPNPNPTNPTGGPYGQPYTPSTPSPNPNPPPAPYTPPSNPPGNPTNPTGVPYGQPYGAPSGSPAGGPRQPPSSPIYEPAPGSGGPTIPGMSMGGSPFNGPFGQPASQPNGLPQNQQYGNPFAQIQGIASKLGYSITPQMMQSLGGLLGGAR